MTMAEQRKKAASICVKNGAKSGTVELFCAPQWCGPVGMFRLRHNRCWVDGTHGTMRFFSQEDVCAYIAHCTFGTELCAENCANNAPYFPYKMRVSVPNGRGACDRDVTTISTEAPFRGADGRWYVGAHIIGRGVVMVPCADVVVKEVR